MHDVESAGGEFDGPSGPRCRVTQRTLELSMWLYASLPRESRVRLKEAARSAVRPEVDTVPGRSEKRAGLLDDVNGGEGR